MLKPPNYDNIIENIKKACPNINIDSCSHFDTFPHFDTFIQMWGSTCLGFDVDDSGNSMFGGQMMTEAYTTIVELSLTLFIVCFDEEPCYAVTNPTNEFYEDIRNRRMVSKSEAGKRY